MSDRCGEPGVLSAVTLVRTLNEHRIIGFAEHPARLELHLSNGQTLRWEYGGMDEGGDMHLEGDPRALDVGEAEGDHEWTTLCRLDRTSSCLDRAQHQLPLSGVGTYGPAMRKIGEAQAEVRRLVGEQFRKVVKPS